MNPIDLTAPGFWMHETSGVLAPVVSKYLHGNELTPAECATMRAYLRQWINAPLFVGVEHLRASIDSIHTTADIHRWLNEALDQGIDPL